MFGIKIKVDAFFFSRSKCCKTKIVPRITSIQIAPCVCKVFCNTKGYYSEVPEYNRKYDALAQRYHTAEEKAEQLQRQKVTKRFQADVMECFMTELMTIDASLPVHYSDRLWLNLVDRVTVFEDGNLVFRFKNGMEITEML